jgi:cellulose synthase/poly-beta-1,6-N-acetylglucosamine synthase-like glycosyltransferase
MEAVAAGCVGWVLYVLVGYPLLLGWRARRPRPVRRQFTPRSVSVLLPVHNGAAWLARKLESLRALEYPADQLEIFVLLDGGSDGSEEIARRYAASDARIRVLALARAGKAVALNHGMEAARGEILFFTDVRQPLAPDALQRLVACFADPAVGVVTGELILTDGRTQEEAQVGLYWKYEKWIRRRLSALDSVLGATGCIYAMRRELARPLPPDTLLDDVHLPLYAFRAGYRIVMEEAAKAYDEPVRLEQEFRRKVRTQAGIFQIMRAFPELITPGRRMWLDFVSYKAGRLSLPWVLLLLAAASWGMADPLRPWALGAQGAFYATALVDLWIPERTLAKRLTAPVRTFVALMAAAACAVAVFFVPPQRLWRIPSGTAR